LRGKIRENYALNRFRMFAHQNARTTLLFAKFCQVNSSAHLQSVLGDLSNILLFFGGALASLATAALASSLAMDEPPNAPRCAKGRKFENEIENPRQEKQK
jgi:hypothetical protein